MHPKVIPGHAVYVDIVLLVETMSTKEEVVLRQAMEAGTCALIMTVACLWPDRAAHCPERLR